MSYGNENTNKKERKIRNSNNVCGTKKNSPFMEVCELVGLVNLEN